MKRLVIVPIFSLLLGLAVPTAGQASPMGGDAYAMPRADRILVKKSERRLYLYSGSNIIAEFPISLGPNPQGPKFFAGDGRTPEGTYYVEYKNPNSHYHRSLKISYPNSEDRRTSAAYGLAAGGMIMIHGLPTDPVTGKAESRSADWTEGCIAVSNQAIDEIWNAVDPGTVVEIDP